MLELTGKGRIDKKEVLRYLGYYGAKDVTGIEEQLNECEKLIYSALSPKACFEEYAISCGEKLNLGFAEVESKSLAKNLEGCSKIVLFAATVGAEVDRLILKYAKLSPGKIRRSVNRCQQKYLPRLPPPPVKRPPARFLLLHALLCLMPFSASCPSLPHALL